MRWAVVALVLAAGGCPRGGDGAAAKEPIAEPVPAEVDWPDAAERVPGPDAGVS